MKERADIIQAAVEACELELYGIERTHEGLAVYIERENNSVSIKDCEAVMKQINYATDTDHLHIEVSSKGIYPPLLSPKHYQDAISQWVKIRTTDKSYKGEVLSLTDSELTLKKGENTFIVSIPSIKSARLIPPQPGEIA